MLRRPEVGRVVLFDADVWPPGGWAQRDAAMAEAVLSDTPIGERPSLWPGNLHTRLAQHEHGIPMGARLTAARASVVELRLSYGAGTHWNLGERWLPGPRGLRGGRSGAAHERIGWPHDLGVRRVAGRRRRERETVVNWKLPENFETPGGTVRWNVLGSGDPVVLVHGTPYSSLLWRDIAPALALTRRVFVFDLLGYGQSDQHEGQDLSIAAQAKVLRSLLDHWDLPDASLVAHDIGGAVTLRSVLLEGADCRDLTLFDAVSGGEWERGLFQLILEHAEVFEQLPDDAHEALVATFPWLATRGRSDRSPASSPFVAFFLRLVEGSPLGGPGQVSGRARYSRA